MYTSLKRKGFIPMAKYQADAEKLLKEIGGKENIAAVSHWLFLDHLRQSASEWHND